jgi:hypothetical protein
LNLVSNFSFLWSSLVLELECFSFSDDDKLKKTTTVVLPLRTSTAPVGVSQEENVVENPSQDILEKIVSAPPTKRHKKMMPSASVSLEAHQPLSSSDNVSITFYILIFPFLHLLYLYSFTLQPLIQRFLSLGTDCVKIQKDADESKGMFPCVHCSHVIFLY